VVLYDYIYLCFSAGTLTTCEQVVSLRSNHGDECNFLPTTRMPTIFGEFLFW
jgi:hypothetical protein